MLASLWALSLAASVIGQDASIKVTMTEYGAPARAVLAGLGKRAGLELDVDAAIAAEPLEIDCKDASLPDLMKRIADALGGEWASPKPGVFQLKYGDAQRARDWQHHIEIRTEAFRKSLARVVKNGEVEKRWTAAQFKPMLEQRKQLNERRKAGGFFAWEAAQAQEQKLPIGRALARLAALLDPGDLAALDWDERIVYSSAPTHMQRPLGPKAAAVIQALNAEHSAVIAAMQAVPEDPVDHSGGTYSDVPQYYREELQRPITQLMVIARRKNQYEGVELVLCGTDSQGLMSIYGSVGLAEYPPAPAAELAQLKTPIELSELALAYQAPLMAANMARNKPVGPIGAAMMDRYLHPERDDPLRFVIGEGLLASARAQKLQLVASPPDDMFQQTFQLRSGKTTVSEFLEQARYLSTVSIDGSWFVFSPRDRFEAILHRTPRLALGKYLASVHEHLMPPLDDSAAFAVAYQYPSYSGLCTWFERLMGMQSVIWSQGHSSLLGRALRLWGLLTGEQRRSLRANLPVPYMQLTREAKEAAEYLTFRASDSRVNPWAAGKRPGVTYPNILWEPTQSLPDGIPGDTELTLGESSKPIPFSFPERGVGFIQAMNYQTVAMAKLAETSGTSDQFSTLKNFRLGVERTLTFRLVFSPAVHSEHLLMSAEVDMSKPPVEYEGLPADYRKAVEAEIKRQLDWRAARKNQGAPPVKNPPPAGG